jgi:two-component system chemotaxis response regulator CheB
MTELPADLPATILVVQHVSPESPGLLPTILDRAGSLPVSFAEDGKPFQRRHVYVAPPDRHLLVDGHKLRVVRGPRENRHRPAIDPLFRSAAAAHGSRVIGVVLTGMLDDGAAGLWAIRTHGGVTVVQDPAEARFPDMPLSALRLTDVDYCLTLTEIAQLLSRLSREPRQNGQRHPADEKARIETEFAMGNRELEDMNALGRPSTYACPSCGGSLWEIQEGNFVRYRCHIGHAFQAPSLLLEQSRAIESALEAAQRALEEKAAVLRRLSDRMDEASTKQGSAFAERAHAADESAGHVRALVERLRE